MKREGRTLMKAIGAVLAVFGLCVAMMLGGLADAARAEAPPVRFAPLPERTVIPPVIDCGELVKRDFLTIEGAATRISSAELETKDGGVEFCHVKGMIAPQIQFEVHLPT
jgi:feruloyl esterase